MIHTPITRDDLDALITASVPTWSARARREAATNEAAGRHASTTPIWGDIKSVFVRHQRNKCGYCEARLGTEGIDWHVEHFRPKGRVDAWPARGARINTGTSSPTGYYLLAFDPSNYLASCAACNSVYKRNYFPVFGRRALSTTDPAQLARERPCLLNPLDASDDAPEKLIGFEGVSPVIVATDPRGRRRAEITIELLNLHDRENLSYGRAKVVRDLWIGLEDLQHVEPDRRAQAERVVEILTRDGSPFTNCARSFKSLYGRNRPRARTLAIEALDYLDTHS